jgi:uncharacterized protein (DUF1800 family)
MGKRIAMRLLLVAHLIVFPLLPESPLSGDSDRLRMTAKQNAGSNPALTGDRRIIHLLNRAGFGPRPGDLEKVRRMGVERYLEVQLQPSKIDDALVDSKLKDLKTLTMTSAELMMNYPRPRENAEFNERNVADKKARSAFADPEQRREMEEMGLNGPRKVIGELAQAKVLRAVHSERQLYEVMVDFWSNHFNVFAAKGANKWLTTPHDRDVIRRHAMGKFKELLMATAKSPAMLFYLDNWMSTDPNATFDLSNFRELRRKSDFRKDLSSFRRLRPENREMMSEGDDQKLARKVGPGKGKQKRGLNENYARELMELHTLGVDGGYTQKDITEVARCFTGWTIARPRQVGEFFFARVLHDDGEKTVLGQKIEAGGGMRDGERVFDLLVRHPSTARFIATKLTRRFVADAPPPYLVDRVAEVFRKTDGDIPAMLRSIFTSPEFNSSESYRAKIKTPFELVVSAIRAVGAETDGGVPILKAVAQMGEPLFLCQPPTGYADTAEAWLNTGALLHRLNFGLALSSNRLRGTRVDLDQLTGHLPGDDSETLLKRFAGLILQNDLSDRTLVTLQKQLNQASTEHANLVPRDVSLGPAKIAGLLLGSPEFQRQ